MTADHLSRLPRPESFNPSMPPPVIKVIETPEEAAKMLQHHPAKENRYDMLKLNSLAAKAAVSNNTGHEDADDSESQTLQQSAMTVVLPPLDEGAVAELNDWIECCATTPSFADPQALVEPLRSPATATATGRVDFAAFGCADGEILLLKSCPAGEGMVGSARFLGHGNLEESFEAATMSVCFLPPIAHGDAAAADENNSGTSGALLASSGEDGMLRVWSVDSLLSGKGAAQSLCCEVSGLDGDGADYRRRVGEGGKSIRVPSIQLVACSCTSFRSAPSAGDGVGNSIHTTLGVAVGRSLWLVELSSDGLSHRCSVQLGIIHSTATGLQFADLPGFGTSVLAACYGAVSIWDEASLQRGTQTPPSRTLDYKGPLLGLCVSMGGAFVGAGCQDATMHVWKIAAGDSRPAAGSTVDATDSIDSNSTLVAKTEHRLPTEVRATAAITEVSCGGYSEKVNCCEWSSEGFFLATSGGQHAIVWNFSDTSDEGCTGIKEPATFPVGKKEAAAICCGHGRRIAAMAFGPCAVDERTQVVRTHCIPTRAGSTSPLRIARCIHPRCC